MGNSSSGALYLWHNGTVHWIAPNASSTSAISASGSDIFFPTQSELVGQDTDDLLDVYDARIGGGFPAPPPRTCPPESEGGCQGSSTKPGEGEPALSSTRPAGGNLTPGTGGVAAVHVVVKPKPLTRAQKLAKALKACTAKPKRKRAACKAQARKKYGPKPKPQGQEEHAEGQVMLRMVKTLPASSGRYLLAAVLAVCAMGLFAGEAAAATTLGITMTHANAYGDQAKECPSGHAEPLAETPCGVDPLTETEASDKGENFARESGSNSYTITVTNTEQQRPQARSPSKTICRRGYSWAPNRNPSSSPLRAGAAKPCPTRRRRSARRVKWWLPLSRSNRSNCG